LSNPAFRVMERESSVSYEETATLNGTIKKTIGLFGVTIVSAIVTGTILPSVVSSLYPIMVMAMIVAAILAIVTCFKPNIAEYTTPGYAVFEGVTLGVISLAFEHMYAGIVAIAVATTFAVMGVMLFLWQQKIIVVTEKVRSVIISLTMGVAALYLINMVASIFWTSFLPRSGVVGIGIAVVIAAVAAFNFLLDFDNIEQSVQQGMPKYMEYFNAFSLLLTLVWLYLEILRIIQMIMSLGNDD